MNYTEILKLAAKAAGYKEYFENYLDRKSFVTYDEEVYSETQERRIIVEKTMDWDPINNDGDALRLAVKLGLCFGLTLDTDGLAHWGPVTYTDYRLQGNLKENKFSGPFVSHGPDSYSATRRAIVLAAAAIGATIV